MASGWATDLLELSARAERKKADKQRTVRRYDHLPQMGEVKGAWEYQVWAVFAFYAKSSGTSLISLDFLGLFYQEKRTRKISDPFA